MDGRRGQEIFFYSQYNFEKFYKKACLKTENIIYNTEVVIEKSARFDSEVRA